jgi:hypothetical protein
MSDKFELRVRFVNDRTFALYRGKKLLRIFHNLSQLRRILDYIENVPKFLKGII